MHTEQETVRLLRSLLKRLDEGEQLPPGSEERVSQLSKTLCEVLELRRNTESALLGTFDLLLKPYVDMMRPLAESLAAEAVRSKSAPLLAYAIDALLLDCGTSDPRDLVSTIALVGHSADVLAQPLARLLEGMDKRTARVEDGQLIEQVLRRPACERRIKSYDYAEDRSSGSFRYVRT